MKAIIRIALLALLAVAASPNECFAAKALSIDIYGPGQTRVNMVLAEPRGLVAAWDLPPESEEFSDLMEDNLAFLPFIKVMERKEILGGAELDGVTAKDVDFRKFRLSKADLVMTMGWKPEPGSLGKLECRVYDVFGERLLTGKAYYNVKADNLPNVADMFSAAVMEALTGKGGFFRSRLAFTKTVDGGAREIHISGPQGRNPTQVTSLGGSSISPSWSPDGRYVVFGHHSSHSHTLGVWDSKEENVFRANLPGTTISGTAFDPAENRAVVALSRGNMEIFSLTKELTRIHETLVRSWAIDVSPSFSADGGKMAFVSDRHGNPNVYVKDMQSGEERRVTYNGKYNTSPSLSPDGRLVAFSRLTDYGHRIFVHNLQTEAERQVSFGPGNDEEPAFSPDGYFIAFSSNRGGEYKLYLTTIHGAEAMRIPVGEGQATHPSFGPSAE
jgi:TolB protein